MAPFHIYEAAGFEYRAHLNTLPLQKDEEDLTGRGFKERNMSLPLLTAIATSQECESVIGGLCKYLLEVPRDVVIEGRCGIKDGEEPLDERAVLTPCQSVDNRIHLSTTVYIAVRIVLGLAFRRWKVEP